MKAVVSTVSAAQVSIDNGTHVVGSINQPGLLVLLGIGKDDTPDAWRTMARKIAELRLLPSPSTFCTSTLWEESPRNSSVEECGAPVLLVSQFTLMGRTTKGRRPNWSDAAPAEHAEPIFNAIVNDLRSRGIHVETGKFGAMMTVSSTNMGPYTVLIET